MGDRLATMNMGRKLGGGCASLGDELGPHVTQCGLGRGLPPYKVDLDPSIRLTTIVWPKIGGAVPPFWGGELGLHLTQYCLGQGLPPYQVTS